MGDIIINTFIITPFLFNMVCNFLKTACELEIVSQILSLFFFQFSHLPQNGQRGVTEKSSGLEVKRPS